LNSNTSTGADYTILVYSGDTDSVVPYVDTELWISNLNLPIVEPWRAWWANGEWDYQVAGYVQRYQGLTFATVKGAGHMVPQWKRSAAMTMFNATISGTLLPYYPYPNTTTTTEQAISQWFYS